MTQVIEIDTSLIDHEQNNRRKFDHVPGLAASIAKDGQDQPVVVVAKDNGRYKLISGHSRTMACASLGIKVKAIVREDLDDLGGRLLTLRENDNRQQTNDIEKAIGYNDILSRHPQLSVDELARSLGKRADFVQKRLDLLKLRPDLQKFVEDGQLTIGYAVHLTQLDSNFQLTAFGYLRDNPSPTPKWFMGVCGELYAKQCQQGLFGWGYGDGPEDSGKGTAVKMPLDPSNYRPSFNPADMRGSVMAELERWQGAAEGWRQYGKGNKAEACQAIVATLGALLAALPAVAPSSSVPVLQVSDSGAAGRVVRLLQERGEMTRRDLLQYGNMTGEELTHTLAQLREEGKVSGRKAGRGQRWSLVAD